MQHPVGEPARIAGQHEPVFWPDADLTDAPFTGSNPSPSVSHMVHRRQRMAQALYTSGWKWGVICGATWGLFGGCLLMHLAVRLGSWMAGR